MRLFDYRWILILCLSISAMNGMAQSETDTVQIADPHFLEALLWWGVDEDDDQVITFGEAASQISLYVSSREISDLTGIEAFSRLEQLYCANNQLTQLDVSGCTSLTLLDCGANQLKRLDLSSNGDLNTLYCGWNELLELEIGRAHV